MSINIITAINKNNAIGMNNQLLYKIKKDLQRFKSLTRGNHCLMGKNTFESLPNPLPKRTNVVLTSDKNYIVPNGVIVESSFEKILNHYLHTGMQDKDLFICGGSKLYEQVLPYTDKVFITLIHDDKKGDTHFPYEQVKQQFKEIHREEHAENGLKFEFINYVRKENV